MSCSTLKKWTDILVDQWKCAWSTSAVSNIISCWPFTALVRRSSQKTYLKPRPGARWLAVRRCAAYPLEPWARQTLSFHKPAVVSRACVPAPLGRTVTETPARYGAPLNRRWGQTCPASPCTLPAVHTLRSQCLSLWKRHMVGQVRLSYL